VIAGRHQHAVDAQAGDQLTQLLDLLDRRLLEHRRVRSDVVAEALGLANHGDRLVEHALARAHLVVRLAHAVEVDVDRQPLAGRDLAEHLGVEQQAVGAQVDVTLARDDRVDERRQLRVERRLAAAQRDGGRPALIDGGQAGLERQAIGELTGVTFDRAADAREVACVQRLQHQHEREALVAAQRLLDLIADLVSGDM